MAAKFLKPIPRDVKQFLGQLSDSRLETTSADKDDNVLNICVNKSKWKHFKTQKNIEENISIIFVSVLVSILSHRVTKFFFCLPAEKT